MTDKQIEAIALDISCGEVKGPEYGCALAGARAVRDEMQAELERVKGERDKLEASIKEYGELIAESFQSRLNESLEWGEKLTETLWRYDDISAPSPDGYHSFYANETLKAYQAWLKGLK